MKAILLVVVALALVGAVRANTWSGTFTVTVTQDGGNALFPDGCSFTGQFSYTSETPDGFFNSEPNGLGNLQGTIALPNGCLSGTLPLFAGEDNTSMMTVANGVVSSFIFLPDTGSYCFGFFNSEFSLFNYQDSSWVLGTISFSDVTGGAAQGVPDVAGTVALLVVAAAGLIGFRKLLPRAA